jgi:cytochrome c nitrite reductase small subunit
MKKLRTWLKPPLPWQRPVIILAGIFFGLTAFVFYSSRITTYLGDQPETCINCHVMIPHYANWAHDSHRRGATCNDCHVPHNNIVNKYFYKGTEGFHHAAAFTLRLEHQVIIMEEEEREMVQQNCIRCHGKTVSKGFIYAVQPDYHNWLEDRWCIDCHREIPHSIVNGLASTPNALSIQRTNGIVPEWLSKQLSLKN